MEKASQLVIEMKPIWGADGKIVHYIPVIPNSWYMKENLRAYKVRKTLWLIDLTKKDKKTHLIDQAKALIADRQQRGNLSDNESGTEGSVNETSCFCNDDNEELSLGCTKGTDSISER